MLCGRGVMSQNRMCGGHVCIKGLEHLDARAAFAQSAAHAKPPPPPSWPCLDSVCIKAGYLQLWTDATTRNTDAEDQDPASIDWLAVAASHYKVKQAWTDGTYSRYAKSPWRQGKSVACNFDSDTWGTILENLL